MNFYSDKEFNSIIKNIVNTKDFQKLKEIKHHGQNRFDHSLRVAYYSYKACKFLHLNYQDTTIAALLHDYFSDEVAGLNQYKRLTTHPKIALENANNLIHLTPLQRDIIKTHMWPITIEPPKYLESFIVDIVDDVSAIYETASVKKAKSRLFIKKLEISLTYLFLFMIKVIKY